MLSDFPFIPIFAQRQHIPSMLIDLNNITTYDISRDEVSFTIIGTLDRTTADRLHKTLHGRDIELLDLSGAQFTYTTVSTKALYSHNWGGRQYTKGTTTFACLLRDLVILKLVLPEMENTGLRDIVYSANKIFSLDLPETGGFHYNEEGYIYYKRRDNFYFAPQVPEYQICGHCGKQYIKNNEQKVSLLEDCEFTDEPDIIICGNCSHGPDFKYCIYHDGLVRTEDFNMEVGGCRACIGW